MKLNYSKKTLVLSLIIFILVLILNIIFTNLLLKKIVSINDKVKQLDISSQKREDELGLKDLIASSKIEREKLTEYFIGGGNAETVRFTEYLESLALTVGVEQKKTLAEEKLLGLDNSTVVSAIRFKFNVSGKWSNVFEFLKLVESLPKVMSLNKVTLSINSEAVSVKDVRAGSKIWSADLDFLVAKLMD